MDRYDFLVIGAGAGGEAAAYTALGRGQSVAVVERELFGGSCAYWACMPSKSLLFDASRHRRGGHSWQQASARRDYMINRERRDQPDDSSHEKSLIGAGGCAIRGTARILGPGLVEVTEDGGSARQIRAGTIIVATGSQPTMPGIEGLAETRPWTNREATSTRRLPRSLVVLGGGATGVELASVFARFGVETALVHSHDRLLDHDHPRNSAAAARILRDLGVELRLGARAKRVRPNGGSGGRHVVELSDGGYVEGEQILVALGRSLNLDKLGLENVGLEPNSIRPDGRLRIGDDVYLIGDPAGPEMFTHVSHYQGVTAVRMALGEEVVPDYRAVPRAVFLEPEIASVGMSLEQAQEAGIDSFEKVVDFASTARGYEVDASFGHLAIVVDRQAGTLMGASIVAPDASAAIHEPVLAIQATIPISVLVSMIHAFPTTSRAFDGLYEEARKELGVEPVHA